MPSDDAATPWVQGRFDRRAGPRRILFGRMYEDPAIEAAALPPGGRVLCIASAGCTARRLAERHEVVAVDINPVQLAYARRRLAGAPAEVGAAERVMDGLRRLLPLAGVGRDALREFLALDSVDAQVTEWEQRICTRRFQFGLDALLSLTGLRVVYASPFLEILPPRFGRVMLSRLARGFATHPNRGNPYARLLLLGAPPPELADAPPTRIELVGADAASYLEGQPAASFSGFTLSNILDGAVASYRARLFAAVKRAARPDAVVVLRSFAEPGPEAADNLAARDRSMIWGLVQAIPAGALS